MVLCPREEVGPACVVLCPREEVGPACVVLCPREEVGVWMLSLLLVFLLIYNYLLILLQRRRCLSHTSWGLPTSRYVYRGRCLVRHVFGEGRVWLGTCLVRDVFGEECVW